MNSQGYTPCCGALSFVWPVCVCANCTIPQESCLHMHKQRQQQNTYAMEKQGHVLLLNVIWTCVALQTEALTKSCQTSRAVRCTDRSDEWFFLTASLPTDQ